MVNGMIWVIIKWVEKLNEVLNVFLYAYLMIVSGGVQTTFDV